MKIKAKRLRSIQNQIRRINTTISILETKSNRFSTYRALVFFCGIALGVFMYYTYKPLLGWMVIGLSLILFTLLVFAHKKIIHSIKKHSLWVEMRKSHVARMVHDWESIPATPIQEIYHDHPFEKDLDITGHKSLLQLIDTTLSYGGRQLLTQWLLNTHPDVNRITKRQKLLKELSSMSRFRDRLVITLRFISKKQLNSTRLFNWLERKTSSNPKTLMVLVSAGLTLSTMALFLLNLYGHIPALWPIPFGIYALMYLLHIHAFRDLLYDSLTMANELAIYKSLFMYIEQYPYPPNSSISSLCQPFLSVTTGPSKQLKSLDWIETIVGLRMNPIAGIILNVIFPWDFYVAHSLNSLKIKLKDYVPQWMNVFCELEALVSLANFAYLNPEYCFATYITEEESQESPLLEGTSIGHPLIPDSQRIYNDFSLKKRGDMALITGSNMSGKSTFLKSLGINLCLAYAGGPVVAERFSLSLFTLYTCIKINDSVTEGVSYFYAEVKRLKSLLDELTHASSLPLFFLIDEIFKGTNNRERLIGSNSYIHALIHHKGIGAIATHDLELTQLADTVPGVNNFHFKEDIENGKMIFDYTIRSGPCPTTNALLIMKHAGLPIHNEM